MQQQNISKNNKNNNSTSVYGKSARTTKISNQACVQTYSEKNSKVETGNPHFISSLLFGKEYVRSELLKSNGNTNSIWKIINHCLPNREPPLTTVEDPVVQANRFNDFYISVGQTAAVKAQALCDQYGFTTESVEQAEPITEDLQNINKFEFHAVTEKDIEKIIKHIPSNKAPGHDRVSTRVLKDSLPATLPVITY